MDKTQREPSAQSASALPHQYVRAITPGSAVHTVLAVAEAARKEARNGPFWMVELKDATGSLPARIWSPLALQFTDIPVGRLVEVEGRAERYREQTQMSVSSLRLLTDAEAAALDTTAFMPASARSPLLMLEELEALADEVLTHAPWRDFLRRTLRHDDIRTRLLKAPAARGIHHARVGGLLEHTLGVVRLCLHFAELYPQLDRQALFAGAVCHDLGKLWELTSGLSTEYTDEGRLAGHIFLGLEHLRPHMEAAGLGRDQVLHLQHLILSHHGEYAFGSPRLPQTAEALALHYADNMDAKMDQCRSLFSDMQPEEAAWSPFQKTLERSMFRAPRTPQAAGHAALTDEFPQNDMPLEDIPQDIPQDDFPQDDFPLDDMPLEDIPLEDIPLEDIPQDDFPQDIPDDRFPQEDIPPADSAFDDDAYLPDACPEDICPEDVCPEEACPEEACVFEHITDDHTVDAVLTALSDHDHDAPAPAEAAEMDAVGIDADDWLNPGEAVSTEPPLFELAAPAVPDAVEPDAVEPEAVVPDTALPAPILPAGPAPSVTVAAVPEPTAADPVLTEPAPYPPSAPESISPEPPVYEPISPVPGSTPPETVLSEKTTPESTPQEKPRHEKTRLEVRQCSLL